MISQGSQGVHEYVSRFRMLVVESKWTDQALISAFKAVLQPIIGKDVPLRCRRSSLDETRFSCTWAHAIGTYWEMEEEQRRWFDEGHCLYCGQLAHFSQGCSRLKELLFDNISQNTTSHISLSVRLFPLIFLFSRKHWLTLEQTPTWFPASAQPHLIIHLGGGCCSRWDMTIASNTSHSLY